MTTPPIPAHIMEAAKKCVEEVAADWDDDLQGAIARHILAAVLAERERCAEVAEHASILNKVQAIDIPYYKRSVAAAIRAGEPT